MDIVNLSRNQAVLQGGQILTRADMFDVYDFAVTHGYSAHMNADSNGNDTLGLTAPGGGTSQQARIITLVPQEQASSLYSIT